MGTIKDYRNMLEQPWGRMFYDIIYRQLDIPNDKRAKILDFGAGFCLTSNHYAKYHEVTAIEPNEDMYSLRVKDNDYELVTQGIEYLECIPDNTYDYVICHNVLEYVEDAAGVLNEIVRVLKPGGRLSIVKHNELGKVPAYAVLNDNPKAALDVLNDHNAESTAFGDRNLYNNDQLENLLADTMKLTNVFGIRSLFGLSSNNDIKFSDDWYQPMLELEIKADAMDEFKRIAFYNHLIFEKNKT
ncbi:class I SAM-dependent methyltransferase [Butyrivibrio proteoclasticus]|uniref:class I SAM-dependent methyltransferase n=1 Tax=Butyrivibrio proteoclasticus TaxID=43305 RepID=UPI00047A42BD|nr:class I SAM-dependent methyltransferase [Butyrivibrio proteoclasticus]